jgi:hypothetical protein
MKAKLDRLGDRLFGRWGRGEGPKGRKDGRWEAVERRGLFYVELSLLGGKVYTQIATWPRTAAYECDPAVLNFATRASAERIAEAMNEASDEASRILKEANCAAEAL